jgi:polar amino acid transport system substrate-binding protein
MMHFNATRRVNNREVVCSQISFHFLSNNRTRFRPPLFRTGAVMVSLLMLLLLGSTACTSPDSSWERVSNAGVLVVGLDPTFPPFENADEGELVGLDVDLARALGRELGVSVEFRYLGYDGLYDGLATKQVDVLLSALVVDETKRDDFAFSDPYFNAGQFLVVVKEGSTINSYTDLVGQTVAVELGAEGHVQAIRWERQLVNLATLPLNTAEEALAAVVDGRAQAAVVDHVSGRLYLQANPSLHLLPEPVTVEPYALVTRHEDGALLEQLNEALAHLEESGELGEIIGRWLD